LDFLYIAVFFFFSMLALLVHLVGENP